MQFSYADRLERLPDQFFAALVEKAKKVQNEKGDVINLGQGNPDQPTPDHIVEALQTGAEKPKYHKYSPFRGLPKLKEAAASYYEREYGVSLDPEREVAVLFGAKTGLVEISQCLLNPGDTALVPDPGYPDYWSGIALSGAKMEKMPLTAENNFLPVYDAIPESALEAAKLLFINYPNNPTGAAATESFFKETVDVATKQEICVVHDFAYGAIGFDGYKPPSFLQTPGAKEVGVEAMTLSKTYNMAGWRVAFMAGNESVIEAINLVQDHMYCSLFGAVQEAAAEALTGPQDSVRELAALYERRRDVLMEAVCAIGWDAEAPAGSFFAWLPVAEGFTSEGFADYVLEHAQVVVAPGRGFGESGEGYVRVALLEDESRLAEAVERIGALGLFGKK
ncbi:pyridoxal phosphate-dependent aminotransferase [Salsuginibacillus kocurii]|uniref:pyridoxal phosphate-dependent aminotransferase n=1 Tax=Salsuginibacillus kocurii TaxID=427078 RepID=UPI0003648119|nr:pyridoxal phosphate-dependent aminotransferase [Salsuginibacillus kocurii]